MSVYIPCLGQSADGKCGCGATAATEIQVGWHRRAAGEPAHCQGGQYEEVCLECYDQAVGDAAK